MALGLALWAAAVAGFDLAQRRVPNAALVLVLAPALLALALTGAGLLQAPWTASLTGAGLALGLTLPAHAFGWLGAGDAKFAAVLGLLLGSGIAACLLAAALVLGAQSLGVWLLRRDRKARIAAAPALSLGFIASLAGVLPVLA